MHSGALKLHIFRALSGVPKLPFLSLDEERSSTRLFQHVPAREFEGLFQQEGNIAEADYVLVPHDYSSFRNNEEYLKTAVATAERSNKTLIVFAYQDSNEPVPMPRSIIFRPSQYGGLLSKNEIIMPAYVEDLLNDNGLVCRRKGEKPKVGFVGKAGFESVLRKTLTVIKDAVRRHPYKSGVWYRAKTMDILLEDRRIDSDFIVRRSYSGNVKSISLDPSVARTEYVENMAGCDFALAPKGDGNYSLRFYEALSLGRIPVLIDTDCVLPLEDRIRYDEFILRVPHCEIGDLPDILVERFNRWSQAEYDAAQRAARSAFEQYLYMPSFLRTVFNADFLSRHEL